MEYYQDIWVKGKCIRKGVRDCLNRYNLIEPLFKKFNRPISVLDIGANFGYYSFRLSEKFSGTYVMIEGTEEESKFLKKLCNLNNNKSIILLNKRINLNDLNFIAKNEHFDIVIALNVIHHFKENFNDCLNALSRIGDHIIFEHPHPKEIYTYNINKIKSEPLDFSTFYEKTILGQSESHTTKGKFRDLLHLKSNKNTIIPFSGTTEIISNYNDKMIHFKSKNTYNEWIHGLNFNTFIKFNGVYPDKDMVLNMLDNCDVMECSDVEAWNFIISQDKIKVIDIDDYRTYIHSYKLSKEKYSVCKKYSIPSIEITLQSKYTEKNFERLKFVYKEDKIIPNVNLEFLH